MKTIIKKAFNISRNKPVPGGASQNEYRQVMQTIMDSLSSKNMEAMLFLCKDYIPSGRDLSSSLEFCKYLEDRGTLGMFHSLHTTHLSMLNMHMLVDTLG